MHRNRWSTNDQLTWLSLTHVRICFESSFSLYVCALSLYRAHFFKQAFSWLAILSLCISSFSVHELSQLPCLPYLQPSQPIYQFKNDANKQKWRNTLGHLSVQLFLSTVPPLALSELKSGLISEMYTLSPPSSKVSSACEYFHVIPKGHQSRSIVSYIVWMHLFLSPPPFNFKTL